MADDHDPVLQVEVRRKTRRSPVGRFAIAPVQDHLGAGDLRRDVRAGDGERPTPAQAAGCKMTAVSLIAAMDAAGKEWPAGPEAVGLKSIGRSLGPRARGETFFYLAGHSAVDRRRAPSHHSAR